jgi:flagellar motility protein MotE (MotC chaperone)
VLSGTRLTLGAGLTLALALAPVVARASNEKAPVAETKHAEAKAPAVKPAETKAIETKAVEAKAVEAKPAEAKVADTKPGGVKAGDAKPGDAKPGDAKPGDAKTETKAKVGKPGDDKAVEGEETAEKAAKPVRKKKASAAKEPPKPPGEGPSPASPPPLTMGGLRDEVRREGAVSKIDPAASPRTKVEQMLSEIVKTREALHTETVRLEGMMAQDPPEAAAAAAGAAPGGAAAGAKPAKNPLDILAKALRGIKPEQAAPIVSRLDKRLAATVLQRMPPIDAGKIMGAMKPDTAAELATQIALRVPEGKK